MVPSNSGKSAIEFNGLGDSSFASRN